MRRRFFVERFDGTTAALRGEAAHHLGRVLRAQPGQLYELSNGEALWLARIERAGRDAVEFALVEPLPARTPSLHVILLLAIVKFDRFEWSLEKATELGVAEIVPLAAAHSEKSLVTAAAKRAARWQKILLESAQQSRRMRPPVLHPSTRPSSAFELLGARVATPSAGARLQLLLSERPEAPPLRSALEGKKTAPEQKAAASALLAVGPEGGWTDEELSAARAGGFLEISLGPNILRTETAVIAALAALSYALGD